MDLSSKLVRDAAWKVSVDWSKDRRLIACLMTAFGGLFAITPKQKKLASRVPSAAAKSGGKKQGKRKKKRASFNLDAMQRLARILRICVPELFCYETALLGTQSAVLVARSLLSLRIARKSGDGLAAVLRQDKSAFLQCLLDFLFCGIAGSVVNSALKYLTNCITVAFRVRLTKFTHERYFSNRSFYKAAVLRMGDLDNADQRIVDDLHQFCKTAADLFGRTFKPLLDVVLNTRRMAETMGYQGLCVLYGYFVCSGFIVRAFSPPFSKMIAQQQVQEGNFRRLHSRLIANAEEVAFLDGADQEKVLLNEQLTRVSAYNSWYFAKQFQQGIMDQFCLKYFASMIGWPVLALPFLLRNAELGSVAEVAARYRESDVLIQNASSSVGDLLMIYKKVQRLLGFSDRVLQLLDAVDVCGGHHQKRDGAITSASASASAASSSAAPLTVTSKDEIRFSDVAIYTPEPLATRRLLLKDLNLAIKPGTSILVTGANGAGKTSLFRVLAGLWDPSAGTVHRPSSRLDRHGAVKLFYVPQRPYLVTGSLRDQISYPRRLKPNTEEDDRLVECLRRVHLAERFLPAVRATGADDGASLSAAASSNVSGLDRVEFDWADVLSGGEQQRIGLARLYFHRPVFAVLDEATSAINADEEGDFYAHFATLGITVFSIAHRLELQRFHQQRLHFYGDGRGSYRVLECTAQGESERADFWRKNASQFLRQPETKQ